jgi:predicted ATPase/class 3 adenylate cyclase
MRELPTGTVTLLFTDIEGSTRLLQQIGHGYDDLLSECRRLLRAAFGRWRGCEVDTQGDAFFVAFARATDAVSAAVEMQRALAVHAWPDGATVRVRVGLHTGEPQCSAEGYVGLDVHRAARIMSAGHGGQVLLSQTTRDLVEHDLPDGVDLRDLGTHRLKDLSHPRHLFQLVIAGLPADFPPLKTLDAHHHTLPLQSTPLIGREPEVAEISTLLTRPEMRMITLLGPGGIGKTHLAITVATQIRSCFAGGTCFVGLAAVTDPQLVVPTIARELGLKDSRNQPPLEQVQAFIGAQPFLLVLDNFEQIVTAAHELEELLAACPRLTILVTSRAVLHLSAEQVVPIIPLSLPSLSPSDSEAIDTSAAVTLFVQRARTILPSFQLTPTNARAIAEVCVQLDGLPLAIELAAARVRLLPPQALLARLSQRLHLLTGGPRSLPARQQTLRSTIQWSYDLLGHREQTLFRLLSLFVDGWTIEAAEALCQETGHADLDVLNSLSALLDNSLIQASDEGTEEPRFQMLQTVREFGLEQLTASGALEKTRAAHACYFLTLAEQAEPELHGPHQALWVARLEHEHDNLRTALEWALEQGRDEQAGERREIGMHLSAALRPFWLILGHYREARAFLERALALSEDPPADLHARVLRAIAAVADCQGDIDRIETAAKLSLALARDLEDTCGIAESLGSLAAAAWLRGKVVEAISLHEEQVRLLRQVGEPGEVAAALFSLAEQVSTHGEYDRGQALFEEALALFQQAGNELWVGGTLVHTAAWLWFTLGDPQAMRQRFREGQTFITRVGDRVWSAECLWVAALLALAEGETERASNLAEESLSIYREMGDPWYSAWVLHLLGRIELERGELRAAHTYYQQSLVLNQQMGEKWMTPFNLEGLASVDATQGAPGWAARLWGAAEALREAIDVPRLLVDRVSYEQAVTAARAQLGEEAFAAAWQEGRTAKLEQVIDEATHRSTVEP